MGRRISMETRRELVEVISDRYREASRKGRVAILDEFVAITGYHRKHALRVLNQRDVEDDAEIQPGRRIYDEAVRETLTVLWETSDRICGKRLKAAIPLLVEAMERHGHLELDEVVKEKVLTVSPATIDRLLAPARTEANGARKRRRSARSGLRRQVPVRTFADWDDPAPGFFEADFVAHCGGSLAGSFIHSFMVTDIASGWTEGLPMIVREQSLVVEALNVLRSRLPVTMLGIDTDNDGAFINETLLGYCDEHGIEFTRSRPYRKNDQAWIEQKNGSVARRIVGYGRLEGVKPARALHRLYEVARQYVNFFQPSFKLLDKTRDGAKVKKRYHPPTTPCERLLMDTRVSEKVKKSLSEQQRALDPVALLRHLRSVQTELVAFQGQAAAAATDNDEDIAEFLAHLPTLWKQGEARPTHRRKTRAPRHWRTRVDPFEAVWDEIESWLQADPDITGKILFERLQKKHPGEFTTGQLRTLQRRVQSWRRMMARALIFTSDPGLNEETEPRDADTQASDPE